MSVHFILGRPGTGKTAYCLRAINEQMQQEIPMYYIVPEQFSLQAERLLLEKKYCVA